MPPDEQNKPWKGDFDVVVLKVFSSEIEVGMARQVLQDGGVNAFIFKDDAGGMEAHLQRTSGGTLVS
jgi:hypothetical protein